MIKYYLKYCLKYYMKHYVEILDVPDQGVAGFVDSIIVSSIGFSLIWLILGTTYSFPFFTVISLSLLTIALRRYIGRIALMLQVIVAIYAMPTMCKGLLPLLDKVKDLFVI